MTVLHTERFVDQAPRAVYATLLEEGQYLASVRTFYRLLAQAGESGERRAQRRHPNYAKPELLATAPNQLWSSFEIHPNRFKGRAPVADQPPQEVWINKPDPAKSHDTADRP